jgi:transposase
VTSPSDTFPSDLAAAHAMILAQCELLTLAKSEVTVGRLEIERLKLMLAKARRKQYGQSSERGRLVEQLELAVEDIEEVQAEQETAAEIAAPAAAREKRANRPRLARRPLPVPAGADEPLQAISAQGSGERHSRIWTCKSSSSTAASKRNS